MSNIFELAYISGQEDYFTATLEYLIDNIPQIGQTIVHSLFAGSDQPIPKFIQAIEHPALSAADRPDFLIKCDRVDILCEHKLDSDLGNHQLERYVKLAERLSYQNQKKIVLALISNRSHSIPTPVLESSHYLQPLLNQHFYWEDFYPAIATRSERLAQEFAEFMRSLGMCPIDPVSGWEDLFTNDHTVEHFQQQWQLIRSHFNHKGVKCGRDGADPYGFRIHYPLPWLHLLYLYVRKSAAHLPSYAPCLMAAAWIPETHPYLPAFKHLNEEWVAKNQKRIWVHDGQPSRRLTTKTDIKPVCAAVYSTQLSDFLTPNPKATQQAFLDFALLVFNHIQETTKSIGHQKTGT